MFVTYIDVYICVFLDKIPSHPTLCLTCVSYQFVFFDNSRVLLVSSRESGVARILWQDIRVWSIESPLRDIRCIFICDRWMYSYGDMYYIHLCILTDVIHCISCFCMRCLIFTYYPFIIFMYILIITYYMFLRCEFSFVLIYSVFSSKFTPNVPASYRTCESDVSLVVDSGYHGKWVVME